MMKISSSINILDVYRTKEIENNNSIVSKEILQEKSNEDEVTISKEAGNIHKLALKSNDILSDIEQIKKDELKAIKEKLDNNFYTSSNIIEKIASSMLEKDEFSSLFVNEDVINTVKEYIDIRQSDIEKVEKSRASVSDNKYINEDVYEMVAEDIMDMYM